MAGIVSYLNALPNPYGTVTIDPSASVVAYVRATQLPNQSSEVQNKWVPDIASGLARCRSGRNDIVVLMQGHTENISATTFSGLVAGTRIVGLGRGSNRPNLRWTATTSQLALNKADCIISNCILRMEGAVVVKAVAVTAADCGIIGCDIDMGSTASTNLSTIGIEIGAGADRFELRNNYIHTIALATPTTIVSVAGVCDGAVIMDNKIYGATSAAAIGVVHISAAATNLEIARNVFWNKLAASTACFSTTSAISTGAVYENYGRCETDTTQANVFLFTAGSLLSPFQNFATDKPILSGLLSPVVVT